MNTIKTCSRCKQEKSVDDFHKDSRARDGKKHACKGCECAASLRSYYKNKQHYVDSKRKKEARTNEWYLAYKKTLCCQECGESHIACIEFHHRDPSQKDFDISKHRTHSEDTVRKEMAKCDILCSNCHRKRHYNTEGKKVL